MAHAVIVWFLCAIRLVAGASVSWRGSFLNFTAPIPGTVPNYVLDLYENCYEFQNSQLISDNQICVTHVLAHMLQAVSQVGAAFNSIVSVTDNYWNVTTNVTTTNTTTSKRSLDHRLRLPSRLHSVDYRKILDPIGATSISGSYLHPQDGIAVQMNVHSGHHILNVHTNGTHAMAKFDDPPSSIIQTRDSPTIHGDAFHFDGVDGLKVEAHGLHKHDSDLYCADIDAFAYGFAYSSIGIPPYFQDADSWVYEVCNKNVSESLFYGKIIVEIVMFDNNYEQLTPPGCGSP